VHVHPAIKALRSNPVSQRPNQNTAQTPMASPAKFWHEDPQMRDLASDVAQFGQGARLSECVALGRLLSDHQAAMEFARSWCADLLDSLRHAPLSEVPFRYRQSGGFSAVQLLRSGRATLSLTAYERQSQVREPETTLFIDVETTELIVSGSARGMLHRRVESDDAIRMETSAQRWRTGDTITVRPNEARQIIEVDGSLLVLQLTRTPIQPAPTCEFALADSGLLRMANGDKRASGDLMALSVLGALEHVPALELMDRIATDPARDPDLRWEAVRQMLAFKPEYGFAKLGELAQQQADRLSVPSATLRAQLLVAHPQLAQEAA